MKTTINAELSGSEYSGVADCGGLAGDQEQLLKFKLSFTMAPDAMFITDTYGTITDANKPALELLGLKSFDEFGCKNVFSYIFPGDKRKVFRLVQDIFKSRQVRNCECQIVNKNGAEIPLEVSFAYFNCENSNNAGFVIIARDVSERRKHEHELEASLLEKETLLKEIHHRVKNNLQIIHSILNLQGRYVNAPELLKIIEECQHRIRTMSFVHECLYKSKDISCINLKDYMNELMRYLYQSYLPENKMITLYAYIDDVEINLQTAAACGIIFNELISNSLKYAFRDLKEGNIYISFGRKNDRYVMGVKDNGIGFEQEENLARPKTFGFKLVSLLTEQLGGHLAINTSNGTEVTINFPQ
ncbi:MAG: histidine kinase dimerization/phosphoacceptor domain -containing protein [Ignavibacteriales bacterium]